jgi:hypothetical protein
VPGARGAIWNTHPSHMHAWVADVEVGALGGGLQGSEGWAFLYTRERVPSGSFFGTSGRFEGLAVVFDSEDDDKQKDGPSVTVFVNDGEHGSEYRLGHDGHGTPHSARCNMDFRNSAKAIARIVYKHHKVIVQLDTTGTAHDFVECAVLETVSLPTGYYFGVTASAGHIRPDAHVVHALRVASLSAKHAPKVDVEHEIAAMRAAKAAAASGSGAGAGSASSRTDEEEFKIPELGDIFDDERYDDDFFADDITDEDWEWDDEEVADAQVTGTAVDGDPVEDGAHAGPVDTTAHKMGFRKFDEVEHADGGNAGHGAEARPGFVPGGGDGDTDGDGVGDVLASDKRRVAGGGGAAGSSTDSEKLTQLVHHVDRLSRYLDNMETSIESSLENVYSTVVDLRHEIRTNLENLDTKLHENSAAAELHAVVRDHADGKSTGGGDAGSTGQVAAAAGVGAAELEQSLRPILAAQADLKEQIRAVAHTLSLLSDHTQLLTEHAVKRDAGGGGGHGGGGDRGAAAVDTAELQQMLQSKLDEHATRQEGHDRKLRNIQKEVSSSWYTVIAVILLFQVVFLLAVFYFRRLREEEKKWV